jgi:hypothetical protein
MKPTADGGDTLTCRHEGVWPPAPAYLNETPDAVRANYGEDTLARFHIWRKECGLMTMNPERCRTCPHVFVNGKSQTPKDGGGVMPPFMRRIRVKRP